MSRPPLPKEAINQYPRILWQIRKVARECGYAIGVHGSQTYDLDLVACPWIEDCCLPGDLASAIAKNLKWFLHPSISHKPHGRKAYLIYGHDSAHIDLSVMPKKHGF